MHYLLQQELLECFCHIARFLPNKFVFFTKKSSFVKLYFQRFTETKVILFFNGVVRYEYGQFNSVSVLLQSMSFSFLICKFPAKNGIRLHKFLCIWRFSTQFSLRINLLSSLVAVIQGNWYRQCTVMTIYNLIQNKRNIYCFKVLSITYE